jgi:hypothetical protein
VTVSATTCSHTEKLMLSGLPTEGEKSSWPKRLPEKSALSVVSGRALT